MDELVVLGIALGLTGVTTIAGLIGYKAYWQPARRRRMEREHFRNKLN